MEETSVLVVGDDTTIEATLVGVVSIPGHVLRCCRTRSAMHAIAMARPDVVLVGAGAGGALTLCRWIRSQHPDVAVVFVAADASDREIVAGLDAGASDYLVIPLSPAVLAARIRAYIRTARVDAAAPITIGALCVDPRAHRVFLDHRELNLNRQQFRLLLALVRHAGTVVTHEQLLGEVWDLRRASPPTTLKMHIHMLRRLLSDDPAAPTWITTVRSIGYRFETR